MILYKTKLGLKSMDSLANKHPKIVKWYGNVGIIFGFLGMAFISFTLVYNLLKIFITPQATAAVSLVLPFKIKGVAFVPFFYWIIAIFIIAVAHEFSHGVLARLSKIKIKSSGFAFLSVLIPILPAAFVEPEEKQLAKKSAREQLSIFAAGPFANIVLGILFGLIFFLVIPPIVDNYVKFDGLKVIDFLEANGTSPAQQAGLQKGEVIKFIDDKRIEHALNLTDALANKTPGDIISVRTDEKTYSIKLGKSPQNESNVFMGISFSPDYGNFFSAAFMWFVFLIAWCYMLNIGIGLVNLLPLGPIDGGRMLKVVIDKIIKNPKKANMVWAKISFLFLIVLLANILFGFFKAWFP